MFYRVLLPALALAIIACSPTVSPPETIITSDDPNIAYPSSLQLEQETLEDRVAQTTNLLPFDKVTNEEETMVNYRGFLKLTLELQNYRRTRTIDLPTYAEMLKEEGVLLLDTRSQRAFEAIHLKGAVHLNFSDFTEDKLASVIPSKDTKVLIYCNNNFRNAGIEFAAKSSPLALNIPTFINLYGYGYENIYELQGNYTKEQIEEYLEFEEPLKERLQQVAEAAKAAQS
ncbi:MAG: rhodanese-like domain-containing protein [Bacteroidota bacterium]